MLSMRKFSQRACGRKLNGMRNYELIWSGLSNSLAAYTYFTRMRRGAARRWGGGRTLPPYLRARASTHARKIHMARETRLVICAIYKSHLWLQERQIFLRSSCIILQHLQL